MSPWTAKGNNSLLPSSTGWWGKAGGQNLFPRERAQGEERSMDNWENWAGGKGSKG